MFYRVGSMNWAVHIIKKSQTMGTLVFKFEHLSQLSMDPRFKDPTLKIEVKE